MRDRVLTGPQSKKEGLGGGEPGKHHPGAGPPAPSRITYHTQDSLAARGTLGKTQNVNSVVRKEPQISPI